MHPYTLSKFFCFNNRFVARSLQMPVEKKFLFPIKERNVVYIFI